MDHGKSLDSLMGLRRSSSTTPLSSSYDPLESLFYIAPTYILSFFRQRTRKNRSLKTTKHSVNSLKFFKTRFFRVESSLIELSKTCSTINGHIGRMKGEMIPTIWQLRTVLVIMGCCGSGSLLLYLMD
ncbi:hypothetical protein RUND412_003775 [Rhizina undulata]